MNLKMKRITSRVALLCFIMLLCLSLYSCDGLGIGNDTTDETDSTGIFEDINWSDYKIISSQANISAAHKLKIAIKNSSGLDIQVFTDNKGNSGNEILIGHTNRSISTEIIDELSSYTFAIEQSGDTIVMTGTNDYLTNEAVDYFIAQYFDAAGNTASPLAAYRSEPKLPTYLVKDSKPEAGIVYSASGGSSALLLAKSINNEIKKLTGTELEVYSSSDTSKNREVEILVGMTGRTETQSTTTDLNYGKYILSASGKKLVVNAWDEETLSVAVSELCKAIRTMQETDDSVGFFADMQRSGAHNETLSVVPAADAGKFSKIYYNGEDSYIVVITGINETQYNSYNDKLGLCGFTQYTDNEINNNLFFTFVDDLYVITNIYVQYSNEMRIVAEPLTKTALPELKEDTSPISGTKVNTLITQIGLEVLGNTTDYQNGMSYLIRLEDGSFIVIDGGHNRAANATNLFNIIKHQAPDANNIVIAAWIFTHPHTDHAGTFRNFIAYSSSVTVEKFIFNFTDEKHPETGALMYEYITGIKKEISERFQGAEVYKAHPGQQFYIRNATIEILYSLDLMTPENLNNYNRTSLMFTLEVEEQKIMFLGDYTMLTSEILIKMYGNTLASDFVQVGHHGYSGGLIEMYSLIDPKYVLWPLAEHMYESSHKNAPRNAFFKVSQNIEQICVAGDNVWVVELTQGNINITKHDTINAYLR